MAIDCPTLLTRVIAETTSNRTLNSTSSWTQHLTTPNFTTSVRGPVIVECCMVHGYEAGAVNTKGRLQIDDGSTSSEMQLFVQGHSSNHAFGTHHMSWTWYNVAAGTHHVELHVINCSSGTTGITNYFSPGDTSCKDYLVVTYMG